MSTTTPNSVSYTQFLETPSNALLSTETNFMVVAVKGGVDDWAAYVMLVPKDAKPPTPEWVAAMGTKLDAQTAKNIFFPHIAGRYRA